MRSSAIRYLAVTDDAKIVAAAFHKKTVQIWSWSTGQQLGEFQTVMDAGGRRLALTPDGSICVAGAWGQRGRGARGLAAYSVPNGKVLWNRSDIRHIQRVSTSSSGKQIYCSVDDSSAQIIEVATGETSERVRGAREIIASPYTQHQLVVRKDKYLIRRDTSSSTTPLSPFSPALLDAAFSPEGVCLSEVNGGVRLIDLATGKTKWHIHLHAIRLAYRSDHKRFYCVGGDPSKPDNGSLIRLPDGSPEGIERVLVLGARAFFEHAFSPSGKVLVTVNGDVFDSSNGSLLAHLDFPQRDYPDK